MQTDLRSSKQIVSTMQINLRSSKQIVSQSSKELVPTKHISTWSSKQIDLRVDNSALNNEISKIMVSKIKIKVKFTY